ncbi:MAG: response regulator [Sulfurimonadaceae bacterium]|jgi:diguanylate cyclase (GGDEF)-like protein|nr:response regulator [Sulfurimonadaceae bacterium]
MKKILIVEDNKTLAKLISKKIEIELNMQSDIAYSLHEAKLFLSRFEYLLAILDINLPDAPNGEVVDYVISKGHKAIVLTGIIDKTFRKNILQKDIIDYVNKSSMENINYVINTIDRLLKNQNHKVLLVEDNIIMRKQTQKLLENMFFEVSAVAHGEEALGMLSSSAKPYSLVLTDYHMPVMDGFSLVTNIRKEHSKNSLAIIASSSSTEDETIALFLKNGANDFIKKPFSKEEFICRINNTIESLENIHSLTNRMSRDSLSGLYSKHHFIKLAHSYFDTECETSFAMVLFRLNNHQAITSKYGSHIKDTIIVKIADIIRTSTTKDDIVARYSEDEFCVILVDISDEAIEQFCKKVEHEVALTKLKDTHQETITFSLEYAALNKPLDTLEESMSELDMLLYKKRA